MVKIFISTGLNFFYKRIRVIGSEHVPKKGAVLLVSNHKNALIDPLLIATHTRRNLHFLTRASAFKIKFVKWILSTVNMLPIYRMRDGKSALAKNDAIFKQCFSILNKKRTLLIFPEGTHDIRRLVRPLSKGFTRITFGVLDQYPELELHIVPVGLNYTDATKFGEEVSIHYGPSIHVNPYYNSENVNASTVNLKEVVSEAMKALTVHVPSEEYQETLDRLGAADFLDIQTINNQIRNNEFKSTKKVSKKPSLLFVILKAIVFVNSFFPILLYQQIKPIIKEVEFISTTKFAIGITAFPLFYALQALLLGYLFTPQFGLIYFGLSVLLVFICSKVK